MASTKQEITVFEGWGIIPGIFAILGISGMVYALFFVNPLSPTYLFGVGSSLFLLSWAANIREKDLN